MNVYVNNKGSEYPEASVIADVLVALNIAARKGMALAVNSDVIPQGEWDSYRLKDNDKIMIIKATQGG